MEHPLRFLTAGLLAATLACGGQEGNPIAPTPPTTPANRAPRASQAIPDQDLPLGGHEQLDMQGYFAEPDGEPLSFEAVSSDAGVVTVAVAGSTLTITAVSAGMADVTVTAADPAGLTAAETFRVTTEPPPNRAPQTPAAIPDQSLRLNENETATVDLTLHFTDPDGDPLSFTAASSDARVVTVAVAGSTLTITAVSAGMADVTVTAADPAGLTAAQTFRVTTEPPPNRAPQTPAQIPDQSLRLNENETAAVDLTLHFTDPDGDPLSFTASSSDARVVTVAIAGSTLTITAVSAGMADVTVTAADPAGLTAARTFTSTVEPPPNRAPLVSAPILGRTLKLNESEKATVDLSLHFADPDGDPLTFEATSGDTRVATASVSNGTLTLLAGALGTANVTVAASDPGGLSAMQAFAVTVEQGRLSAELEVTSCQADGVGVANVVVEGTVRAVAPLSSARVVAYMDARRLGEQALGDMAAGETREFAIRGSATVTASSRCRVELSAGGGSLAAAASVSFR